MNEMTTPVGVGHNRPPPYDPDKLREANAEAERIADAAGAWLDLGEITDEADAQRLTDFISGARAVEKAIEAARVAAKKPHDDAARAVQEAFKRPLAIVEKVLARAKKLQSDFLIRQRQAQETAKRRMAEEAARLAAEAEAEARRAAAANDIVGASDAEDKAAEAARIAEAAARSISTKADSFTGGGRAMSLRTLRTAEIVNARAVCNHFISDPALLDVIQRLANAAIRRGEHVPGTTIKERQEAA